MNEVVAVAVEKALRVQTQLQTVAQTVTAVLVVMV
jgi:hypothetical protein